MKTSDMIKELCNKKNISLSELARRIGQTPQNFGKKLKRDTVTLEELKLIADVMGVTFEQSFIFLDGEQIKTSNEQVVSSTDRFSEKSLLSLGDYYVYGLIDPRTKQIFYIGKGTKNRVFEHEKESLGSPDSEKLKLKTITDIKDAGLEVEKIIINSNLTEEEAFAAEASLINAFNYVSDAGLTNIVAGHHSAEALSVDEYERINGAAPLEEKDIRHKILVIKINRLYQSGMDEKVLYDAVRGVWRASKEKVKTVEYVFGVYNSLIVAVYKPSEWFVCKEAKDRLPRQDIVLTSKTENRLFFVDEGYEQGLPLDENESFYIGKSIAGLKLNQSAQNPITYLNPRQRDKILIQ